MHDATPPAPLSSDASSPTDAGASWGGLKKALFPFVFVYAVLYVLPFPFDELLSLTASTAGLFGDEAGAAVGARLKPAFDVVRDYEAEWKDGVVRWAGERLLSPPYKITVGPAGSGDTTWNYVELECYGMVSAALGLIWAVLGRRSKGYPRCAAFLVRLVRWKLLMTMLGYGLAKLVPLQMTGSVGFDRVLVSYADSTPMGLVWRFMGYSAGYQIFTGAGETLGGVLLAFRRTTTLGAAVSVAVLSNVVALNYFYDVPVKLYSTHLLVAACAVFALGARRMFRGFVLNRPVDPEPLPPLFGSRAVDRVATASKTLALGLALTTGIAGGLDAYRERVVESRAPAPFYGIHDVVSILRDGKDLPLPESADERWQRVGVERGDSAALAMWSGRRRFVGFKPDVARGVVEVTSFQPRGATSRPTSSPMSAPASAPASAPTDRAAPPMTEIWTFTVPEPGVVDLRGRLDGHDYEVRLKAADLNRYPLVSRKFRWINERPDHR
jgi:hypothetical protein